MQLRSRAAIGGADIEALLVVLFWSGSYTVIKQAIAELPPLAYSLARFAVASSLLVVITALTGGFPRFQRGDLARVALIGALTISVYQACFSYGLQFTTASSSALVVGSSPIFTAVVVRLLRQEELRLAQWVGIVAAFLGLGLLVAGKGGLALSSRALLGDGLTLVAAAAYGTSVALSKPLLDRYRPLPLMAVAMAFGTLFMAPLCLPDVLHADWLHLAPFTWFGIAYGAIPAGALAYVMWYGVVGQIGPTRTIAYSYLIPVGAVALAAALLGERFAAVEAVGAAVTLLGVALARWGGARRAHAPGLAQEEDGAGRN
jgi:drug/metabolite transporter (DMT)-like permease